MPELPEVELVRTIIEQQIKGLEIRKAEVLNEQVVAYPEVESFCNQLVGQRVVEMGRRGKFLIFKFESSDRLFLHLRMTGRLLATPIDYPAEKHTHLILHLNAQTQIRYIDVRRFGRFRFVGKNEPDSVAGVDK